jgi:hypothetical protein
MNDGTERDLYKGSSGASVTGELEFQKLFTKGIANILGSKAFNKVNSTIGIQTYLFADAGIMGYNYFNEKPAYDDLRADAGVGATFTIKRWGPLQMVKPLTLRFDVPLFLNSTPAADPDYVKFRWVVGINRTF